MITDTKSRHELVVLMRTHLGAQILVLDEKVDHFINYGLCLVQSDRHFANCK